MADIRIFFGAKPAEKQGGGDVEAAQKRKLSQKDYDKTKRKRLFKESWLKDFSWAVFDESQNALFCGVCRKFPDYADKSSALFCGIKENFRKETLKFHEKSLKHHTCVGRETALKSPHTSQIAQSIKKVHCKNSERYEKLFNTAYFVAVEGEPMTKFPKLCELQEKNGVDLGTNYRNNHGCSDFVSSIADTIKSETVTSLQSTRFLSVLSDGSTDKAVSEQEVVYVRYVDEEGHLQTRLADIVDLEHGDADGVKKGVLQGLDTVGISTDIFANKIVGINTDGASVNMGKKSGAIKRLIDEVKEIKGQQCDQYITVVHCIAHNLELAVCDAKKNCLYLNKFEDVLKGVFQFYYYSPKKRRELYEIAVNLNKELKHFGGVHTIRWVASQHRALKALLDNYETTIIHLEHIANKNDENASKAKAYLKELKTNRFLSFLHFMLDWTEQLRLLSEMFQEEYCLVSQIGQRIEELQEKFEHMKERRGKMFRRYQRESAEGEFRGVTITLDQVGRREDLAGQMPDVISGDINDLLNDTIFFLQERFVKHLGGEPHSLFNAFNFNLWPNRETREFRRHGEDQIESLINLFRPLLTEEENENALDQWLDLKLVVSRNMTQSLLQAYQHLLSPTHTDHERIKYILPLVQVMLTISPSTAQCERGFSTMNRLKTQSRTSMSQQTLQNLLRINVNGPPLEQFNPTQAIHHWMDSATGTRHNKGHVCSGPRGPNRRDQPCDTDSE